MEKPRKPIPVLVALNKSLVSRTRKLCGIFKASTESGAVELKIMDEGRDLTPEQVDKEVSKGVRAFILGANGISDAIEHIGRLGLPFATTSLSHKPYRTSCAIHTGNREIAVTAAKTLMANKTISSFAYYPPSEKTEWSAEREEQFRKTIGVRRTCVTLSHEDTAKELLALPRPIGVFAANDAYAAELIGICRKNNLGVPKDVSVIGVDNEEFLCENTTPSITSIEPDFEREGYEAVKAILLLLDRKPAARRIVCGIRRVVIRKSTVAKHYAAALVGRALEYINEKATSGITVSDVCAHLRVSRRLLGLRFREIRNSTPIDAIIERKLTVLRKELATTDQPISIICKQCGFGSENHPKKLFRERYKMTMRDYRSQARTPPSKARA